jgi:hypothetical protein
MTLDVGGVGANLGQTAGPWFAIALVLLSIAGRVAVNQRRSATGQGQRIGRLETIVETERTRRRQVEAELVACGIPLPFWPPDPLPPNLRHRATDPRGRVDVDVDEDLDDDEPLTAERPRIPVPPLPAGLGRAHRRRTGDL